MQENHYQFGTLLLFSFSFTSTIVPLGNLLVEINTLKPVLLDFGLTKKVTAEKRYYFSKLLVSAAEQGSVILIIVAMIQ